MENKQYIWSQLWFMWLISTIVYLINMLSGAGSQVVHRLLGFFVPYGIWNTIETIDNFYVGSGGTLGILALIVFVGLMVFNKKILRFLGIKSDEDAFLSNLVILVCVTFFVDWILWGAPCSFIELTGLNWEGHCNFY